MTIYKVGTSAEDDRPIVDDAAWECQLGWDGQWKFFTGQIEWPEFRPPKLLSVHPRATDWDLYYFGIGLVSERARKLLVPYAKDYFEFLDASLNGKPYSFLRIKKLPPGVLNYDECEFDFLEDGMTPRSIRKCVFNHDRVPDSAFFCVHAGFSGPYTTGDAAKAIKRANLRGFELHDTEG